MTPLVNLVLFLGLGLCLAGLTRLWRRPVAWISPRLIFAWPFCQPHGGQSSDLSGSLVRPALGIASWVVPTLEQCPVRVRSGLVQSFPVLVGVVLVLAGTVLGRDYLKQRHEAARALPPAGSPNVLFIVLDTVRADHLSLYGYHRPTTPMLERLARRGILIDGAARPHPGHWPRTPACSRATGPTSLMSNG